jgi:hypothetical protein
MQINQYARSVTTSTVDTSEWYLRSALGGFYSRYPNAVNKDRQVSARTIAEALRKANTTSDEALATVLSMVAAGQVDEIVKGRTDAWLTRIMSERSFGLSDSPVLVREVERARPWVVEAFARRHLYAHNDGLIDDHYLGEIPEKMKDGLRVGRRVPWNARYLRVCVDACEITFLLVCCIVSSLTIMQ